MRCERAQELFSEYCEGSVHSALLVPLESHLDACPECRAQVGDLRTIWRILDTAPLVEPPSDFRAAVWRRIDDTQRKRASAVRLPRISWRTLFPQPAVAWATAFALLVVLAGGIVIPGRYMGADLGFPWIVFQAPREITAGQVRPVAGQGTSASTVVVPLRSNYVRPHTFGVTSLTAGVLVRASSASVTLGAGRPAEVALELRADRWPNQVTVRLADQTRSAAPVDVIVPIAGK